MCLSKVSTKGSTKGSTTGSDVQFVKCKRSCKTCMDMVFSSTFNSSINGSSFECLYEFDKDEEHVISCHSVNVVYLLECYKCGSQYVGETVQKLKDRITDHRRTTRPGHSGNYRLRQHYIGFQGECCSFKIQIIQKLAGTGRTNIPIENSKLFTIDKGVTQIRHKYEGDWIRTLGTQFPYGMNDRIDSLENKNTFNCEFAKFVSQKGKRKRTWGNGSSVNSVSDMNINDIVDKLILIVKDTYHSNVNLILRKLLFPLAKNILAIVKDKYLVDVFNIDDLDPMQRQAHYIITDLLMYKIKPYNIDIRSKKGQNKNRIICKVLFSNKGIEMLNLPRILRQKCLTSLVNFLNIRIPTIIYKSVPDISGKIFNYNDTVLNYEFDDPAVCMCEGHKYVDYIHVDCGHVVTGNLDMVIDDKLRDILKKGPKFKEPEYIDFDENYKDIIASFKLFINDWSKKENVPVSTLQAWYVELCDLLNAETNNLKTRYSKCIKQRSIFSIPDVKLELEFLKKHFVLCPVDKATKNVAIICKRFYMDCLLNECKSNSGILNICKDNVSTINSDILSFMNKHNFISDDREYKEGLSHMFSSPKFHKPSLKMRFVVSYFNCSIKPVAHKVTLGLKCIYSEICRYSKMIFKVTGINRNWVILNNEPILETLNYINENSVARNVETYDFSTLYTNLSHIDIKLALRFAVSLAFKNSKKKYIAIYNKSYSWVDEPRKGTFVFDQVSLICAIEFLLDNCYFVVGGCVFKQTIGVPIGMDAGPYIANLTLWYFENRFLESTYRSKYLIAKKLQYTFRLIDDITSLNSDGYFSQYFNQIYPDCLKLNKENESDDKANVLDLNIDISDGKFNCGVFDKRDNFKFDIVQFQPLCTNQASSISYSVFYSQVIRIFRICSNIDLFDERVDRMFNEFVRLGYDSKRLQNMYNVIVKKHSLVDKFGKHVAKLYRFR